MKRSIKFSRKGNSTYAYEDWVINPTEGDDRAPGYTWVVFNSLFRDGNSYENFFGSLNAAKNFVETKEKGTPV
jgi:hypothetical protein